MSKGTIILIEDNERDGKIIKDNLEKEGYEVIWLENYRPAARYLDGLEDGSAKTPVDLKAVIFDYMLAEKDRKFNSLPLVALCTSLFAGRILVANSSDDDFNKDLLQAGCTHVRPREMNKWRIAEYVLSLLAE